MRNKQRVLTMLLVGTLALLPVTCTVFAEENNTTTESVVTDTSSDKDTEDHNISIFAPMLIAVIGGLLVSISNNNNQR